MSGPVRLLRRVRSLAALLALLLAVSACEFDGAYDLPLPGGPVSEDDSFEVTAEFADILNVVPHSVVMVDDVEVGEVVDVERVGWHARITMRVRDDVVLPANAVAQIKQVSLLGEKYVSLEEPTDAAPVGRLADGDQIPLSATGRNPEVEEVLGALSFLLSGGGVAQLGTITRELNDAMDGRTSRLRALLRELDSVVGVLDQQKGDIVHALESLDHLSATLNREKGIVGDAIDATGPAVRVLADQHRALMRLLTSLDRLGTVGTRVIRASRADLVSVLRDLGPTLGRLGDAGDQLALGLNTLLSFPFPQEASEVVKGDYANAAIRADIDLTNLQQYFEDQGLPGLPPVVVPDPGELAEDVAACLATGDITSDACVAVIADADLLSQLQKACAKKKYEDNEVCQALGTLPGLPTLPGVTGDSGDTGAAPSLSDLVGGAS